MKFISYIGVTKSLLTSAATAALHFQASRSQEAVLYIPEQSSYSDSAY